MEPQIVEVLKRTLVEGMKCDEFWRELEARHVRSLSDVQLDGIVDRQLDSPYGIPHPRYNQRSLATLHVLCTIPSHDYRRLVRMAKRLLWFMPEFCMLGLVTPLRLPNWTRGQSRTKLIWLSPLLDRIEWAPAVAVVAHEIAHLVVQQPSTSQPVRGSIDEMDDAAWGRVADWGFESEMQVLFAMPDLGDMWR